MHSDCNDQRSGGDVGGRTKLDQGFKISSLSRNLVPLGMSCFTFFLYCSFSQYLDSKANPIFKPPPITIHAMHPHNTYN